MNSQHPEFIRRATFLPGPQGKFRFLSPVGCEPPRKTGSASEPQGSGAPERSRQGPSMGWNRASDSKQHCHHLRGRRPITWFGSACFLKDQSLGSASHHTVVPFLAYGEETKLRERERRFLTQSLSTWPGIRVSEESPTRDLLQGGLATGDTHPAERPHPS